MKTSTATDVAERPVVGSEAPDVGLLERGPRRIARALLDGGPQTATELAESLGLTGTAVRRHLDRLVDLAQVSAGERAPYGPAAGRLLQRRRGRPAQVFALTATGRGLFHQAYDDLASGALHHLEALGGTTAVRAFADARAAALEQRYAEVPGSSDPVDALRERLTADGYAASVVSGAHAIQLCQHHCPVGHVAAEFPQLCEAEAQAFSRLLGTHVTRLATLAAGDGVCTTLIPLATDVRTTAPAAAAAHRTTRKDLR